MKSVNFKVEKCELTRVFQLMLKHMVFKWWYQGKNVSNFRKILDDTNIELC